MLRSLLNEVAGTFALVFVVLSNGHTIPIMLTAVMAAEFSQGDLNPAVTVLKQRAGTVSKRDACLQVCAQVAGAIAASAAVAEVEAY